MLVVDLVSRLTGVSQVCPISLHHSDYVLYKVHTQEPHIQVT